MPLAIQYGMTEEQFWYGDIRLLKVYQKAYLNNVSYVAWYNGMYNRIAVEIGAKNALVTKKKDRIDDWIEYNSPNKQIKPKITIENIEMEFRKQQVEINSWLFKK